MKQDRTIDLIGWQSWSDCRCTAGKYPYRSQTRQLAKVIRLADKIFFLGDNLQKISPSVIHSYLDTAQS